jgi:hypothetical protein
MVDYLKFSAEALFLTIAIEFGVAWIFRLRSKTELLTIAFINLITNPLLNYLILVNGYFQLISQNIILVLILEVGVVLVEWRLLLYVLRQDVRKMFILSVVMNGLSYIAGLLIFR